MLKKFLGLLVVFIVFTIFVTSVNAQEKQIYFFYGTGCPHCETVHEYFDEADILNRYPIVEKEIYFNQENALLFNQVMSKLGIPQNQRGVPAVVIGDQVLVGDTPIIEGFEEAANNYLDNPDQMSIGEYTILASDEVERSNEDQQPEIQADAPLNITALAVVGASLVDAVNPCAFAVLIILMSTVLMSGNSSKALRAGLAFAASIFISYFLMGLGLYTALDIGSLSGTFFKIVGWLAIFLGLFNLKDYFWYGKGFLMEVPMSWRPKLKKLLQSVTSPIGAFGTGFIVSLFLLPCTSGPYIVILGMLAEKTHQTAAIGYLFLYNLIFVMPMVLITLAVYKGFDPKKAEKLRQKQLRNLHLFAGLIMLAMGIIILQGWV